MQARALTEFAPGCDYHQSSPESHFTQKGVCSLALPEGRVTLRDDRLIENGVETPVADRAHWEALLRERFGITLG